jgi:hypothetical protein
MSDPVAVTNPADYAFDLLPNEEQIEHIRHIVKTRPERVVIELKKVGGYKARALWEQLQFEEKIEF